MIWEVLILVTITILTIVFCAVYTHEKLNQPYKPSAFAVQAMCYNTIIKVTDKMGIVRHGGVAGNIGDDIIIGFHDNIAPIKDIDGSTKIDKRWYESYWVVNKDVMYEAYKHRSLHIVKINVKWGFRNL